MDFDCLTRKELQFLCKRNKIPANITNVAMADALKALEIVEGLDEFKNQSPEKTMTSTRRKPSKEEHQATQSTIRTRKTVRNVSETPVNATNTSRRVLEAEPEIKDENPSQSCRGRDGVGSRKKVEAQKGSSCQGRACQTGYATRRSVRLLGKSMSGLSLKGNEKVEPVKDDEMVESEIGNNNGQSWDTSELPLVRNLSSSLEDEREKDDDVEEKSECNNEKNDEPEGEDKSADGSDAIAVSEDAYEIENLKPVADETDDVAVSLYEIENLEEEMVVEKSIEVLVANAEASEDMEAIDALSVEENANQAPQEIECQKPLGEDCEINAVHDDLTLLPKAEEYADDQVSQNVSVLHEGHMDSSAEKQNEESDDDDDSFPSDSDFDNDTGSDSKSLADGPQEEVSFEQKSICIPTVAYSSEGPMTMVNEEALVDDNEDDAGNEQSDDDAFVDDLDIDNEDPMANMVYEEALVDANVTEVGTIPVTSFHSTSQSVVDNGDPEALIDVCVKPAKDFAETAAANSEITITSISSMSSPLKADQLSQPRKSSSKKQTTIPKVTQVLENINKENIDNHSVKKELDLGLKKVKKNKNLEDLSLRHLKKLITEKLNKLEIADKNKEDDTLNKQPFGKIRPALQTLSQNSMKSDEIGKLN